ncbi:unnamed protein product [Brachionus calyciflorus]|uniref:Cytochrome p450 n=1 Tax=Brachionus calyciflorus TaxID=104777 RepID=A0A813QPX0_9BILA|nr:unnamed protein product [Brachionus calyciflorus]
MGFNYIPKFLAFLGPAFLYFGYFTFRLYFKKKHYKHIPGPQPIGIFGFYFGNLTEAIENMNNKKMYPYYLQECFKKYGPVFKIQLFNRIIVYSIDPEIVKYGLQNFPKSLEVYKNVAYPYNIRFLGESLLTQTDHKKWKRDRNCFHEAFSFKYMKVYADVFDEISSKLIERLRQQSLENEKIDLTNEFSNTILDILGKVAFGMELNSLKNSQNKFSKNIKNILYRINESLKDPFDCFRCHSHFSKSISFIRQAGRSEILKRLEEIKNQDYVPHDILSIAIANYKKTYEIDIEIMIDNFVSFFIAGLESTVNCLIFLFFELSKYPGVLKKIRYEIDDKIGLKSKVTMEDLEQLEYTGYVLSETLRLWPVVPSINRITNQDMKINEYFIPKGTDISFSSFCAHRNEKFFVNPNEFIPERFKVDPITLKNSIQSNAYFPFSQGPRNCIGQHFVKQISKIIIVKILQNFDLLFEEFQSSEVEYKLNLVLKNALICKLKLRNSESNFLESN